MIRVGMEVEGVDGVEGRGWGVMYLLTIFPLPKNISCLSKRTTGNGGKRCEYIIYII